MAPSPSRLAIVGRVLLVAVVAVAAALGSVAAVPVLPPGTTAGASAAPGPSSGVPASEGPVPSPSSSAAAIPSPSPTASPSFTARPSLAPPSPSASADPSPGAGPIPSPVPELTAATRRALQARLDQLRARYGIPGISAALTFPDGSRWIGTSGLADVADAVTVDHTTGFAIASISKTITAALVLAMADDGLVDLDASVRTYLPGVSRIDPAITVRQLLDHTSGLRDYFEHPGIDEALLGSRRAVWETRQTLRYVGKPYFPPGRGWHYSNTNYFVLGLVAEAVGRANLGVLVRERFLAPLDLDRTWYQPDEDAPGGIAHGYRFLAPDPEARPIDLSDGTPIVPFSSVVTAAGGAGGFASSAGDLATWARALYGSDRVLGEATRAMMLDPYATSRFRPSVPYGLGVQVVEIDGRRAVGHSGRLLGFRSVMRYLPDHEVAGVVLTNQSRTDPAVILRALLRIAIPVPDPVPSPSPGVPGPVGSPLPAASPSPRPVTSPAPTS